MCWRMRGCKFWCVFSDSSPHPLLTRLDCQHHKIHKNHPMHMTMNLTMKKHYHCVRPPAHKHDVWPLHPHSWVPIANAHWAKPGGFDYYNHKHATSVPLSHTNANRKWEHKHEHHLPTYEQWAAHEQLTLAILYSPPLVSLESTRLHQTLVDLVLGSLVQSSFCLSGTWTETETGPTKFQ